MDLDPLAVELGRMALWVETMDRDLPFGFLDHKLKVGNALVGTWFDTYRDYPALAWEREGGDKDYQKDKPQNLVNHSYTDAKGKKRGDKFTAAIAARSKAVPEQLIGQLSGQITLEGGLEASEVHNELLKVFKKLHRLPVHDSDRRATVYREEVLANPHYHALKARMDLWCALWFWPGDQIDLAPLPLQFGQPEADTLVVATKVALEHRFFHWELEFPDVFTAHQSGFDAVLGNPPWETMQPNSKEFFSNHDPLYRAYGKQEALDTQLTYFRKNPHLEHDWIAYIAGFKAFANWMNNCGAPFGDRVSTAKDGKATHDLNLGGRGKDAFSASCKLHDRWLVARKKRRGFADRSHPFAHQGSGKPYLQKMFMELSHALMRPHGRMGMIVPSGVYTDKGTTALRELFLDQCDWQWLFGFENREKVFDIDSRFKFCPLVIQKTGRTQAIRAAFMHRDVDDWANAEQHVLAYPRERVIEFSPKSKAILEILSERDLLVLQKIYSKGVLLGTEDAEGWGVKYRQGDFNMTSDSKLFPPRPKWEEKGYRPDEHGLWLKASWHPYEGPSNILDRERGLILSRDGAYGVHVNDVEDVALPLLEGNIIDQFQTSSKGWVSGKGRSAVWRNIPTESEVLEPQYLIGVREAASKKYKTGELAGEPKWQPVPKLTFIDVTSATNARTTRATCTPFLPCGNTSAILEVDEHLFALAVVMNSFVYDFVARARCGGLHLNWFVVEETVLPKKSLAAELESLGQALIAHPLIFSSVVQKPQREFATSPAERLRLRCIAEALIAHHLSLSMDDMRYILTGCDFPSSWLNDEFTGKLDSKGFWRIDKSLDPELRLPVLSMIAFQDLCMQGRSEFLGQNNGRGWALPDAVCLADYCLGHDGRAGERQPVAERLNAHICNAETSVEVERLTKARAAHAELIKQLVTVLDTSVTRGDDSGDGSSESISQGALF